MESDFEIIHNHQINCVLSISEDPVMVDKIAESLAKFSITHKRLKCANYAAGSPNIKELNEILAFLIESLKKGQNVLIHCGAGKGRTGLVMACLLCCVSNLDANESIMHLKQYFPAVKADYQVDFVNQWYKKKKEFDMKMQINN